MGKFLFMKYLNTRGKEKVNTSIKVSVVIVLFAFIAGVTSLFVGARGNAPVSPALNVIASDMSLVKSAESESVISFSASDFENFIGVNKVKNVTFTFLPDEHVGVLMLGALRVVKNQKIDRENLSDLYFVSNDGVKYGEFEFSIEGGAQYNVTCKMYFLDGANYSPTTSFVDQSFFEIKTFKNIAINGKMIAYDPENDDLTYEIVTGTKKGLLTVHAKETGEYTYTPMKNYVGSDSFTYVAVDKYGNRSEPFEVVIKVNNSKNGTVFYDMIGDRAHYGAILMVDKGIMEMEKDDGHTVFMPEHTVSRAEFVTMAMKAVGIEPDEVSVTVFKDDSEIISGYKGYVSAAYRMGFISGVDSEGSVFLNPEESITRAEACVIVGNIIGTDKARVEPKIEDASTIPEYAYDTVCALVFAGIVDTDDGRVFADEYLTKAAAADILSGVIERKQ